MIGSPLDVVVLIIYFVAVVGFGVFFGKYSTTTKDFYLGGQRFSCPACLRAARATVAMESFSRTAMAA